MNTTMMDLRFIDSLLMNLNELKRLTILDGDIMMAKMEMYNIACTEILTAVSLCQTMAERELHLNIAIQKIEEIRNQLGNGFSTPTGEA